MPIGYVLITTAPAREHQVYDKLKKLEGISDLHPLFGEYDFIVKIEADDINTIGRIVVDKIRRVEGVIDTKTLTGIEI